MTIENFFYLNIIGEIQSANFPLGADGNGVFIRYDIVAGGDWELVSGVKSGITQCANSGKFNDEIVFNMPIECTLKSTNVFGCKYFVNFELNLSLLTFSIEFRATNCLQFIWK